MKVIGEPKIFFGMKIGRDRRNKVMKFRQPIYIKKCLQRFSIDRYSFKNRKNNALSLQDNC